MQYAVLIAGVPKLYDSLPKERQDEVMGKHRAFQEHLKANGRYVLASRLETASTARTMEAKGNDVLVTDGPYAETKEHLLGLYIVEAESMDQVIEDSKLLIDELARLEIRPVGWTG